MENNVPMQQAQGAAVVPQHQTPLQSISNLLNGSKAKSKFQDLLGKRASQFISSALTAISSNSLLKNSTPESVYGSALMAATLDLPVNPNLGFAYFVPYNNKRENKTECQLQLGYKSYIQLAMRTGQYKVINATDIREGEIENEDLLSGEITFKKLPPAERVKAPIVGYAAYFKLLNGFEKTLYMSSEEIDAHASQYSQTYRSDKSKGWKSSIWSTNFEAMAKKTVIKLLLSKYGILSIEMQNAQIFDQAIVNKNGDDTTDIGDGDVIYIDNQPDVTKGTDALNEFDDK